MKLEIFLFEQDGQD